MRLINLVNKLMKKSTMLLIGLAAASPAYLCASSTSIKPSSGTGCPTLLDQKFDTLQGGKTDLCQYAGKVLLVVNTASYCGFTGQYEGLQAVQDKYKSRGLVVLGFPANDFGKQEPGSNAEVADFCERTYKVRFPMIAKSSVVEGTANSLFEALAKDTGQRPKWNFHKYLIGRDGRAAGSFGSRVEPQSTQITAEIERLLGAAMSTAHAAQFTNEGAVK